MVVKATVFILCLVLVPLMMEARIPEDPGAYSARENNVANGQSPREDTKEAKRSFVDLLRDSPGENCICQCCPTDWLRHGQFCYYAEKNSRWPKMSKARTRCQKLGGDLPIIKSADQNEFIFSLARNQTGVSKWGVWLGLTRNADDSKFYWIDGSPLEGGYDNWKMDEPNDLEGHEDCVNLYVRQEDLKRFWNDIHCNFFMPDAAILCQRSINP